MGRKKKQKLAAARKRAKAYEEKKQRQAKLKRKEQATQIMINPQKRKAALFEQIFEKYQHDVYKISLFYAQDIEAAEEATQKTFFNFYLHMDDVKPECIRAYLFRSVRNMTFNWVRDKKALRNGQIDDLNDEDVYIESVEDMYLREEERRLAARFSDSILSRLYEKRPRWYEVIVLVYYLGKSNIQVAQELGLTVDVVNSRLYRAKQWIRAHYGEEYEQMKNGMLK